MADLFDILLAKNLAGGGGGGSSAIAYTSIVDNGDNTITATDDKGVEHTVVYTVGADGKITSVTLDGKTQTVTYDGDVLVKIGNTDVDIEGVPIANEFPITVTFIANDTIYNKVGVDSSDITVNSPSTNPTPPQGQLFGGWKLNENLISFPYIATENTTLTAYFTSQRIDFERNNAGTVLGNVAGSSDVTKTNAGNAILGFASSASQEVLFLVGRESDYCTMSITDATFSFSYNDETWYGTYFYMNGIDKIVVVGNSAQSSFDGNIDTTKAVQIGIDILNQYYGVN